MKGLNLNMNMQLGLDPVVAFPPYYLSNFSTSGTDKVTGQILQGSTADTVTGGVTGVSVNVGGVMLLPTQPTNMTKTGVLMALRYILNDAANILTVALFANTATSDGPGFSIQTGASVANSANFNATVSGISQVIQSGGTGLFPGVSPTAERTALLYWDPLNKTVTSWIEGVKSIPAIGQQSLPLTDTFFDQLFIGPSTATLMFFRDLQIIAFPDTPCDATIDAAVAKYLSAPFQNLA
jgi:hypothetical protein